MRNLITTVLLLLTVSMCVTPKPRTTIKKVKEGWLVTTRNGFKVTQTLYECLPDSLTK